MKNTSETKNSKFIDTLEELYGQGSLGLVECRLLMDCQEDSQLLDALDTCYQGGHRGAVRFL